MAASIAALLEGTPSRDYSVVGAEAERATRRGLFDAEWFRPHVDPDRLRALTERSDRRAIRDAVIWLAGIAALAIAAVWSIGNWWSIPLFAAYGAWTVGAADARWHEFGHGTATSVERISEAMYLFASFLLWRGPTLWRWSHFRHHSDTIVVGRDPEIQVGRPATIRKFVLNYTNLVNGPRSLWQLVRHAFGRVDGEALDFVPPSEVPKMVREARVMVSLLLGVLALAIVTASWVPVLLVGLPTIYGFWLVVFFGATQHLGLREDVLDHRVNTRTVCINPVFRFLYLNMNYHVEHHMFPTVPYYHLPALHREIAPALPPPSRSMLHAYREIVRTLWRQRRDEHYELTDRVVPDVPAATGHAAGIVAVEQADGTFDLGPVASIPVGVVRRVDVDDCTVAVARLASGDVCAVDGVCTHGRALLAEGTVVGDEIECPRHNGRFDLRSGAPTRRPAREPIGVHPVTVSDGRISLRSTGRVTGADEEHNDV